MPVLNDFLTCFCFCWRVIWCRSWWITCFFPRSFRNNITKLYLYCGFIYLLLGLWSLKFNNYEALVRLSDLSCIVSCIICCWQFELRIKEISFLLNKIMWKIWEMRFWIFHQQEMDTGCFSSFCLWLTCFGCNWQKNPPFFLFWFLSWWKKQGLVAFLWTRLS